MRTKIHSVGQDTCPQHCTRCRRLADHLAQVRRRFPDYHARPVAAFGERQARLAIVGLAPGMHGANRTGRPFTGDHAGILLYETLHRFGYANGPSSRAVNDGLELSDCFITNAVKCLPPQNRPTPEEVKRCNQFLKRELCVLPQRSAILALGRIAHDAVLLAEEAPRARHPFGHGTQHRLPGGHVLFDSYHCSRYNTQTRRLTAEMFRRIFADIAKHLERT
ncbi:MAG: uracil-DNA glycosylase [Betaproteobacteria bacterium]